MNFEDEKIMLINNIKTTMKMENQDLTLSDIQMLNDFADNKITIEDAIQRVNQMIF